MTAESHAREFNLAMSQGKTYYKQKWEKTTRLLKRLQAHEIDIDDPI
ncbi:hypothetical protein QMA56_09815 [Leuconostoc falkenbergense]|nr:hypothetical protein [Leuconostoc falkenbergense]MDI6667999.1 hypothetical protein [Leuconostoc falkenbergense]